MRAEGVKPGSSSNPLRSGIHTRGYLPHIKREGASYFVTFRLADSLPREVLLRWEAKRAERLRQLQLAQSSGAPVNDSLETINRDFRREVERYLDHGHGACHLRRLDVAALVAGAITHFDGRRYLLRDWVVMPNHVHVALWPMPNAVLGEIIKSWKQFTARRAKPLCGVTAERFWQPESYDHWIRSDEEQSRICRYIRNNPVKAGLCDRPEHWRWGSAWAGGGNVPAVEPATK